MREHFEVLKSKGICPTCYNLEHGYFHEDLTDKMLYEDELLFCFFEENPRSVGHTIIILREHYHDMSNTPDDVCADVFVFAKKAMNILKETLPVEIVYLCTMCDGPVNHFHLQLIPRHPNTEIGSKNFVKQRGKYNHNEELVDQIRRKFIEK